jgi:hypothetical protein
VAAGFFLVVGLSQLVAGSLVSVSRYEIYVLALGLGVLMVVFAAEADALLRRLSSLAPIALSLFILVLGAGYALRTVDAVKGAHAMQAVSGTLRQFVIEEWRGPVAVSRYSWLSWRNPWPVEPVEFGPFADSAAEGRLGAAAVAARHDIRLAILDPNLEATVPSGWEKVAEIRFVGDNLLGYDFYAVRPERCAAILAMLERFQARLAGPVELRLSGGGTPQRNVASSGSAPGCPGQATTAALVGGTQ